MTTSKIQALSIVQQGSPTRWKARGYIDSIGWLEARGKSLIAAMETLQALASARGSARDRPQDEAAP